MTVGVLAFQGNVEEHLDILRSLKVKSMEVRSIDDLKKVDRLIVPGGESTVMGRFLMMTGVGKEICKRVKSNSLSIYGTCAGAILLARKATGKNAPRTLGLIDMVIDRNAYGSQMQSFEARLSIKGLKAKIPVAFIRAPVITHVGKDTEILSMYDGRPVLVRKGKILAGTFHPEARGCSDVHRLFLSL